MVGIDGPRWLVDPKLALMSVALVDVWKGVGLATVIYIAGIVSIPREYYDAATRRRRLGVHDVPPHHLPLARPGHGDRDHPVADRRPAVVRPDLGDDPRRPGLHAPTSSRRSSTSSTRPASTASRPPATSSCSSWSRRSSCRSTRSSTAARCSCEKPSALLSPLFIAVIAVIFLVPFVFILLTAAKTAGRGRRSSSSRCPSEWALFENFADAIKARDYMLVTAFINSIDHHRRERGDHGRARGDGRLRAAAAPEPVDAGRRRAHPQRADHPARGRPDRLGAAGAQPLQDPAGPDPDRGRLRAVVQHPALPGVHRHHPARARRGRHDRRRPARCACSSASSSRCCARSR